MFNIILYQPEIPPNTGNIIRLCANTGSQLHLIHPLGFELKDKQLRRAGLDYHEWASVKEHQSLKDCLAAIKHRRLYALSTKGQRCYADTSFLPGDAFLFGPETRGLPTEILNTAQTNHILRLPMNNNSRSLNLANSAAVVIYEAWRQNEFATA